MKSSITTRIRFSEADNNCKASFGQLINYFQDCSNYQSDLLGAGIEYQKKTKRAWILSSWQLDINGTLEYGDEIVVSTWPYGFKGVCGRRNFTIAKATEPQNCIVLADSIWVMYDMEKEMLSRITPEDASIYGCDEKLEMEYAKGKIARASDYEVKEPFQVRKYHLDFNGHMNNAWYVRLAEEFLEECSENRQKVRRLRVEYKKSAKYQDVMVPCVAKEKDRLLVELRNPQDEIYAIVEFGLQPIN